MSVWLYVSRSEAIVAASRLTFFFPLSSHVSPNSFPWQALRKWAARHIRPPSCQRCTTAIKSSSLRKQVEILSMTSSPASSPRCMWSFRCSLHFKHHVEVQGPAFVGVSCPFFGSTSRTGFNAVRKKKRKTITIHIHQELVARRFEGDFLERKARPSKLTLRSLLNSLIVILWHCKENKILTGATRELYQKKKTQNKTVEPLSGRQSEESERQRVRMRQERCRLRRSGKRKRAWGERAGAAGRKKDGASTAASMKQSLFFYFTYLYINISSLEIKLLITIGWKWY